MLNFHCIKYKTYDQIMLKLHCIKYKTYNEISHPSEPYLQCVDVTILLDPLRSFTPRYSHARLTYLKLNL